MFIKKQNKNLRRSEIVKYPDINKKEKGNSLLIFLHGRQRRWLIICLDLAGEQHLSKSKLNRVVTNKRDSVVDMLCVRRSNV